MSYSAAQNNGTNIKDISLYVDLQTTPKLHDRNHIHKSHGRSCKFVANVAPRFSAFFEYQIQYWLKKLL